MNKKQSDKSVHPSAALAAKYGYTVEKDQDVPSTQLNASELKLQTFLKEDESYISGEEMRQRAHTKNGNFGLVDGERWKNQMNNSENKFKKWQGKYIVLPGTLLRRSGDHRLYVAFLCWVGDSWEFVFYWLGVGWDDGGRFACSE